mmetsp:Transcript_32838/g.51196  ORF Transcript_32838/g.51196 Transcript_32838/m.51196 type:complete len:133 (+) Transcript_32838:2892-3290(+)
MCLCRLTLHASRSGDLSSLQLFQLPQRGVDLALNDLRIINPAGTERPSTLKLLELVNGGLERIVVIYCFRALAIPICLKPVRKAGFWKKSPWYPKEPVEEFRCVKMLDSIVVTPNISPAPSQSEVVMIGVFT